MSTATISTATAPLSGPGPAAMRAVLYALPALLAVAMIPAAESPFSIPKRALLIAVAYGTFLFAAAVGGLAKLDRKATAVLAGIPAAALLAWAGSSRRDLAGQTLLMTGAGPLLAWTAASLLPRSRRTLPIMIASSGVLETLLAIAQWLFGLNVFAIAGRSAGVVGRMRVFGTMGNPDFLAIYVAATMPALLVVARRTEGRARWLAWAGTLLDVVALGGAASRTGIVAAMAGCAAVLLLDQKTGLRRVRTAIVLIALAAVTATALAWRNPRRAGTAARGRVFTWRVALVDAAHRPLGDGPGTFAYLYPAKLAEFVRDRQPGSWQQFIGYERTANNDFVQAVSEMGWPGAIAVIALVAFAIVRLGQAARGADAAAVAASGVVIAIAAAAMTESPLQRAETWALLWLCIGLACEVERGRDARATSRVALSLRLALAATLTVLVTWIAVRPVLATCWADAGANFETERRYPEAVDAYRRSLAYDPTASSAAFNLPRALAHTGDLEAAVSAANDGLRWVDEPELRLLRLRILESRGSYVAALQAAAGDLKRFPYSPELREEYLQLASRLHSW